MRISTVILLAAVAWIGSLTFMLAILTQLGENPDTYRNIAIVLAAVVLASPVIARLHGARN